MKYCTNCRNKMVDSAKFCDACGTKARVIEKSQSECKEKKDAEEQATNNHRSKFAGKVHRCPNCGEVINAFEGVCSSCGYEIRSDDVVVHELKTKLEEIDLKKTASAQKGRRDFAVRVALDEQKITLINNFKIPTNKEDLYEIIMIANNNISVGYSDYLTEQECNSNERVIKAWENKLLQAKQLAETVFTNEEYEALFFTQKGKAPKKKKNGEIIKIIIMVCVLLSILLACLIPNCSSVVGKEKELNNLVKEVEVLIENGEYEKAKIKAQQIIDDSDWSDERTAKWDSIRESLLEEIDEKMGLNEGKIKVNFVQKDFEGRQYEEVKNMLEQQGFTNITLKPINDLITGWLTKDGEIEEVMIGGRLDFEKNTYFNSNVEVIISYHTFATEE